MFAAWAFGIVCQRLHPCFVNVVPLVLDLYCLPAACLQLLVRFGHYYPERLHRALVINAPAWFSYPWKLMSAFLDANTRCARACAKLYCLSCSARTV